MCSARRSNHDRMVEKRPPFYIVVHFEYILTDLDPTTKARHQQIRLATNMKFAGVNITLDAKLA
jgi:hypothetical protein